MFNSSNQTPESKILTVESLIFIDWMSSNNSELFFNVHNLHVLSSLADNSNRQSCEMSTEFTFSLWLLNAKPGLSKPLTDKYWMRLSLDTRAKFCPSS
jgi:hypothetical protein